MKIHFIFLIFLCFNSIFHTSVFSFDRIQQHENRLIGLDISNRIMSLKAAEITSNLSASYPDVLISQSVSPSTFTQDNASLANIGDTNWVIAFEDNRNGSVKIYLQKYDLLSSTLGTNYLAASSENGADYVEPVIKTDNSGTIYLFYRDKTNGLILGTKLNPDFTEVSPEFLVNDTSFDSFAGPFDFDVYPDGKMVVVWENYSSLGSTIQMKLYANSGNAVLGPVVVNSDGGTSSHWVPSVAVNPTGNFMVAWEDYRNNRADIYAKLYNGAGVALGSDLGLVPPPYNASNQFTPKIVYSNTEKFIIGWVDKRTDQEIYAQKYDASLGLVGGNLMISQGDPLYVNWNLDLTVRSDGNLLASWASFGPQNNILVQRFAPNLVALGSEVTINNSNLGRRWSSKVRYDSNNNIGICWSEFPNNNTDINFNIFGETLSSSTGEIVVNDDNLGAVSSNPFAVPVSEWYNMFVFEDMRYDEGDIFVRTISNSGIALNNNQKINQDAGNNLQAQPSAASSIARQLSLVVWVDSRDVMGVPGQRIYGRFGNEFGGFTLDEFMVSDSFNSEVKTTPKAAINGNGKSLIVWSDNRNGAPQIYGQWINPDGLLNGNDFEISDIVNDTNNISPVTACDNANNFYVIWLDKGKANPELRVKTFTSSGSVLYDYGWVSSISGVLIDQMAADVSLSGEVCILWSGINGIKKLYLSRLTANGTEIGSPLEIVNNTYANPSAPSISVSNNDYLSMTWIDRRDGKKVAYYQIYDNTLNPLDISQPVSAVSSDQMLTPITSALNGRAVFTWVDPRENGFNVYANSILYLPTDIEDDRILKPSSHQLNQNYPNPFNPTTEISFELSKKSKVSLTVYNLIGQEVKVLVNGNMDAGNHSVSWDATDNSNNRVASGIYLYRLKADDYVETKKMVLIK